MMTTNAVSFSPAALSEYLALRWLARPDTAWVGAYRPDRSTIQPIATVGVRTAEEVVAALRARLADIDPATTGLFLSGGIDSAILARLLPAGVRAYTIRFVAPGAIDESVRAARFAAIAGLRHHIIDVTWDDYEAAADWLMLHKRAPLHPVEVGLYKAALRAAADGLSTVLVGNGADSTFGGLDQLLSRDWSLTDFIKRYTFLEPERALKTPADILEIFTPWQRGDRFDTAGFLKVVHGEGVTQAFANAIRAAGCAWRAPYEDLHLGSPLDLARIRAGESKYLLRAAFQQLYGEAHVPEKIAFARPMDTWMANWRGPGRERSEFHSDLDVTTLTGEQRWLLWSLCRFLTHVEGLHG